MRIIDCFLFFNELELLELRLAELNDLVDYFVLVEANVTHTGHPKPFYFDENKDRYEEYLHKIVHIKLDDCPRYTSRKLARIENYQRASIMRGLEKVAEKGDKILVSDMDEIVKPDLVPEYLGRSEWIHFQCDMFYYYVNVQHNRPIGGPVLADYGTFTHAHKLRRWSKGRWNRRGREDVCYSGSWHYSYMGGMDRIKNKLQHIWEAPLLAPYANDLDERVANLQDIMVRPHMRLKVVDISQTKPKNMDKFLEKYPHFYYGEREVI